nr:hypothetical protein GCM10020093_034220 [Planobispora longispora]
MPIAELIARQAARTPDGPRSGWPARGPDDHLRGTGPPGALPRRTAARAGIGPEDVVGVCLTPGLTLPVALVAVLYAGAAYLPLDPAHPAGRRARLAADAGARAVIADDADWLPEGWTSCARRPDRPRARPRRRTRTEPRARSRQPIRTGPRA